jgi:hypothetical protein
MPGVVGDGVVAGTRGVGGAAGAGEGSDRAFRRRFAAQLAITGLSSAIVISSARSHARDFAERVLRNIWHGLLGLDARELDHLCPLLGFGGDQLAEVGR